MAFLESEHYVSINVIRLIKDFDREIKDEGAGNPEEVNKQLNDEKQSMVNIRTLFFFLSWSCWKSSIYLFKVLKGFKILLVLWIDTQIILFLCVMSYKEFTYCQDIKLSDHHMVRKKFENTRMVHYVCYIYIYCMCMHLKNKLLSL